LHAHRWVAPDREASQLRRDVVDLARPPRGVIIMKTTNVRVAMLLTTTVLAAGCGASDPSQGDAAETDKAGGGAEEKGADIASTQQAVYSGWTAWMSEENPPIVCDSGASINSVQCRGSYCDDERAYCQPTGGSAGGYYWTDYFSEESTSWRYCNWGYWVTGLACNGSYCDNNALQCTYISGINPINCYWTGWVSEEGGGSLSFGYHYYPRGMQCSGSHCDNKRFYVCQTGL
jgi:hypothetical protein